MVFRIKYIPLLLLLIAFASCENGPFFNPFENKFTINTVRVPNEFNWSLTNTVDLTVDMINQGENLESIEGARVLLLDTLQNLMARGIVVDGEARLYHRIASSQGKMIVYFPNTGNYEYTYSWACLGTLPFEYAWEDLNATSDLSYLEILNPDNPPGSQMKSGRMKSTVFGNADFSNNSLTETEDFWDVNTTDQKWYVTTKSKGPASIDSYNGNQALKLGQSSNRKVEVFQNVEWTEGGDFEATMQAISPESDRIKVKLYLFYVNANGKNLRQRVSNYNINKPNGWVELSVSGECPEGTTMIKLVIQDQGTPSPYYIDNVSSTFVSDPDSDKDGIPDKEDDYPNDPNKAFNEFVPGLNEYGSLAFEDLWPSTGDYDFNDLVVDYNFNQVRNAENEIVELQAKFMLRAIGGSFHNGFGFELPISQELVASVTGQELNEGIVSVRANGTEEGSDNAIIMVFEDAWNYLRVFGVSFVNTRTDEEQTDPYPFNITITFTRGLSEEELGVVPFNPFIFVNATRSREVHLFGHTPTALMDLDLLGTDDDFSNPGRGQYFKTVSNLPWALDIPSTFEYPEEKNPVDEAYLNFIEWAETSGQSKNDWYQPKDGYRNSEKIFKRRN